MASKSSCTGKIGRQALLGLGATINSMFVIGAFAQGGESRGIDQIVVTAQFREQNLQDVPLSISAYSAEMIDARGAVELGDIANTAPNVVFTESSLFNSSAAAISIRGVGQFDFSFGFEPGVGVYLDDVYYPTIVGAQFDLIDAERVEILRGPQGTLSGNSSIGGAVKLYSKKPTGSGNGYIKASVGRFDRLDFEGAVDFGIVEDVLAVRLSGVLHHGP
ncbi:MAG: TonB-dependent receptor plug domain-containing protein [Bacteroidetes bacterium]|nr:TonB-dependent receptor plug domain-containing protein [Bacteroidota bacterium]